MSKRTTKVAVSSFPTFSILSIIFVIAKLFHVISWSWWLVLLPLWGPVALAIFIFLVVLAGWAAVQLID